ncbi:MAG: crotonase/enoyl-CoA hydratase family protein [Thermoanaerobaculales bacterium]|nr:crotonase/enoyl-CoA hydratase family protein [Thermoanaerobaculales bacterium]
MNESVTYELSSDVAVLTIDDHKVNALTHSIIEALHEGLDRAEREVKAVLLVGRPGRLSGGFDLSIMKSGPEGLRGLVTAGAELLLRLYSFPRPVVVACTGHAMAAGALMLLSADLRIGARGPFKIGLNEVSIGMTLPIVAVELAREKLAVTHLARGTILAEIFDPEKAVEAGFLDHLTNEDALTEYALGEAQRLSRLGDPAFKKTRNHLRRSSIDFIRRTLADDMAQLSAL